VGPHIDGPMRERGCAGRWGDAAERVKSEGGRGLNASLVGSLALSATLLGGGAARAQGVASGGGVGAPRDAGVGSAEEATDSGWESESEGSELETSVVDPAEREGSVAGASFDVAGEGDGAERDGGVAVGSSPGGAPDSSAAANAWFEGTFVGGVSGDLVLMDRARVNDGALWGVGVGFYGVLAPRWSPVMLGLGAGFTTMSRRTDRGPLVLWTQGDGLQLTSTTIRRTMELRRIEALARFAPFEGPVRPFLEGGLGVLAVWESARLENGRGEALETVETQRDFGLLWSGTFGLDLQLFPVTRDETGTYGLLLTLGVRRSGSSRMGRVDFADADPDATARGSSGMRQDQRESFGIWMPFVGLSFGVDARREARERVDGGNRVAR